jgi:hypothetical protein
MLSSGEFLFLLKLIMKKLIIFFAFTLSLLFSPSLLLAQDSDQNHTGLYLDAAETINLSGTYNGDVWVAGGTLDLRNVTINGDLHAVGGQITLSGTINGDAILAGGTITTDVTVTDDLAVFAGSVTLQKESSVGGTLFLAAGDTLLYGQTQKEAKIFTGDLTSSATFSDNLDLYAGSVTLLPQTTIEGNLNYTVPQKGVNFQNPTIRGEKIYHQPPEYSTPSWNPVPPTFRDHLNAKVTRSVFGLLSGLLLGWIVFLLLGQKINPILDQISSHPAANAAKGLLLFLLTPLIFFFFLVSVIGIPLSLLFLSVISILILLSKTFFAFAVGRFLLKNPKVLNLNQFFLGLLLLQALSVVPYLSTLTKIATNLIGLGAQYSYLRLALKKKK